MSCGQEFSTEEVALALQKCPSKQRSMRTSGKSDKKSITEIKELRPRKAKYKRGPSAITLSKE
ncbi:MAG: hypothetical protein ACYTBX_12510 [Planctomycetota bacterium]|jgi:hypothetical protein